MATTSIALALLVLGGAIAGKYRGSDEGKTLKVSYGCAFRTRSTKEAVLENRHPDLKPCAALEEPGTPTVPYAPLVASD